MRRITVPLVAMVLLVLAGCRDDPDPAPAGEPGPGVEHRIDDIESTLDRIESELSEG